MEQNKLRYLLTILFIWGGSLLAQNDTVHLIVIQGESNAAGMAPNSSATTLEKSVKSNVKIWNPNTSAFESMQIGVNNNIQTNTNGTTHGLELYAANAVDTGKLKSPIYIVKPAWSGARIQDFRPGGSRYASMYSWLGSAMSYLNSQGIKFRVTVWQSIGINDYNAGVTEIDFRTQLMALKSELRGALGTCRFISTELLTGGGNHPYNDDIAYVAANDPYGMHQIALTNGVAMLDAAHFNYLDFRNIIGPRIVASMPLITSGSSGVAFTPISSNTEIISPMRGAERWHDMNSNQKFINPPGGAIEPLDAYYRSNFYWSQFEISQGVYDWSVFDNIVNACISRGQKFSFSIMTLSPGTQGNYVDGGYARYPNYVHAYMQGETNKDQLVNVYGTNLWVPNYNSNFFLTRVEALLSALKAHIYSTSYSGKSYKDAIGYIDISIYGMYAEWHMAGAYSNVASMPNRPTGTSLIRIVDAFINTFPDHWLVAIMHAFDGNTLPNTMVPPEVGYRVLTATNGGKKIGWKRMNLGLDPSEWYISGTTVNSSVTYNGIRFDTAISERWKYAPIAVEGPNYNTTNGGLFTSYYGNSTGNALWSWPLEVQKFHISLIANGNLSDTYNGSSMDASQIPVQAVKDSATKAFRVAGYRVLPEFATVPTSIANGTPFNIALQLKNIGVAPVYENWQITYQLRNTSTGAVVWTGTSTYNMRSLLPGASSFSDNFTVNVSEGTYKLVMFARDPTGYRANFPFAITGRQTDGSYFIANVAVGGNVIVPTGGGTINRYKKFRKG